MADDKSIKSIDIDVNAIVTNKSLSGFDKLTELQKHLNKLTEEYNELKQSDADFAQKDLEKYKKKIQEINDAMKLKKERNPREEAKSFFKGLTGWKDKEDSESIGSSILGAFKSGASVLLKTFGIAWDSLSDVLSDTLGEMQKILNASLLTDDTTRENVFKYGMSGAESYGFEKAKKVMGIDDDNLMYMNSQQSKLFRETMSKYAKKYTELYDKGYYQEMLNFQVQREQFQTDVELALIKMFLENKETIITGFKAILTISENLIKALGWMGSRTGETASEILNNYSSKNVSIDTTFNISGQIDKGNATTIGTQVAEYWNSAINNL